MFASLPEDILFEIGQHVTPAADDAFPIHPHWYNVHVPRPPDTANVVAVRATCRAARAAIPAPSIYLDIPAKHAPAVLERWAGAPDEAVQRIKVLRLRPDGDVPQHSLPVPDAQAAFGSFSRLLHRTTALESLVIEHNPFCASHHKYLGLSVNRAGRVPIALPTLPPLLNASLPHLHSLAVAINCPVCTAYLTGVLSHAASASLRVLKSSHRHWNRDNWFPLMTPRPRIQDLDRPATTDLYRHHKTVALRAHPQPHLTRLVAKIEWGAPGQLILDLHQLARAYPGLVELSAVHFDASRKVAVMRCCPVPGMMRLMLTVFAQLGSLRSLDVGLSPRAVVPQAFGLTGISSYELDANSWDWDVDAAERAREGSVWRTAAVEATKVLRQAAPQVVRGAWWAQVGVPDYNQLIGYERVEWELDAEGEVVLGKPKWLAPMLVRNQDGMGSEEADPSQYWG